MVAEVHQNSGDHGRAGMDDLASLRVVNHCCVAASREEGWRGGGAVDRREGRISTALERTGRGICGLSREVRTKFQ